MRPITIGFSPNLERDDMQLAIRVLLRGANATARDWVINWFREMYGNADAYFTYNSCRSALVEGMKGLGIGKGDEVLLQSFTCVAVPNAVLWTGAKPIYCDIDTSGNIDVADATRKITRQTKAILIQHTFGVPADIQKIKAFAKKHSLYIIEDCAHALGVDVEGEKLGGVGDIACFSFGRDKVISSVSGGLLRVRNEHVKVIKEVSESYKTITQPPENWIRSQLIHPLLTGSVLPYYHRKLARGIIWASKKTGLLSLPIDTLEYTGKRPVIYPSKLPNSLAALVKLQLQKLPQFTHAREETVAYYDSVQRINKQKAFTTPVGVTALLRYALVVDNPKALISKARKAGIYLGQWYSNVIDPAAVDFSSIGYRIGMCPVAEKIAPQVINLPTRITLKEAERVANIVVSSD